MSARTVLRRTEYVRIGMFATLAEIRAAERKKARLENLGYSLVAQSAGRSVYVLYRR